MKQFLIAGNWKMNKNVSESLAFVDLLLKWLEENNPSSKIIICPPFTSLYPISEKLQGSSLSLGAQNCHWEEKGAFTGEISPSMIASIGCQYVIIGHSERRTYFSETDNTINRKILSATRFGLKPIFCIGETLQERNDGLTFNVIERQIRLGLKGISKTEINRITIAYEPVWAIGTGVSAELYQIDEAHKFIKTLLANLFEVSGEEILILYGGSLNSNNATEIFSLPEVYGGLIGGASLDFTEFTKIISIAEKISTELNEV
ncbi:MAG: triose-phosphate isomerase [Ignavibacteria bacterium]|nr:triose-phosphate isomerase [Ignavibacteria bacterium]